MPGPSPAGLLGFLQRFMQTGKAMAQGVNRIARQRLYGVDLSRLGPAGFDPTQAYAKVVKAMAWTAALRERLLAVARPVFAMDPHKPVRAKRAPQARGKTIMEMLPDRVPNPTEADWHNYRSLAEPVRIGPGGVVYSAQEIAGLSDRQVVANICENLRLAAKELGAEADIARIDALKAGALALCPEADEAAVDAGKDEPPDVGKTGRASDSGDARSCSDEPEDEAEDDPPPKKPPD